MSGHGYSALQLSVATSPAWDGVRVRVTRWDLAASKYPEVIREATFPAARAHVEMPASRALEVALESLKGHARAALDAFPGQMALF